MRTHGEQFCVKGSDCVAQSRVGALFHNFELEGAASSHFVHYRSDLPLLLIAQPLIRCVSFSRLRGASPQLSLPSVDQLYLCLWRDAAGPLQSASRTLREIHCNNYTFVRPICVTLDHEHRLIAEPNHALRSRADKQFFDPQLPWSADDRKIDLLNSLHIDNIGLAETGW